MYGMDRNKLKLVPHNPVWARDFEKEVFRVKRVLGEVLVSFEHIGSTAIPGVYAKPILDVAILCAECNLVELANALVECGYDYRGQYGDEPSHYYAVLDRATIRLCQVHIYTEFTQDLKCKQKFRDVLSNNAELASIYCAYKRQLADQVKSKGEYAAIKTKWLDTFIVEHISDE